MAQDAANSRFDFINKKRLDESLIYLSKNPVHAILLDLGLPDSSGLDSYNNIYYRFPDIPIIVLTGYKNENIGLEAVQKGAQDFFVKGQIDGKLLMRSINYSIERKMLERRQRLVNQILEVLNNSRGKDDVIKDILVLIKKSLNFEAVGIRLKEGVDYPYYEAVGFPAEFIEAENSLCAYNTNGELIYDSTGNPVLECMCGNIIGGKFDPTLPFFTDSGSFWTNCTTELLSSTTEENRQGRTRNRCNGEGYESVALIPLHANYENIGLLQFNDKRKGMFDLEMIRFFEDIGSSIGIALRRKDTAAKLEKWAQIFEHAEWGVVVGSADGKRLEMMNPAFARMHGYDIKELTDRPIVDVFAPESRKELPEQIRIAHEKGHYTFESKHIRKDGTIFPVIVDVTAVKDKNENVIYRAVNVQNITKQKQIQIKLEAQNNLMNALINSPNDFIIFSLDKNYNYTMFNENHKKEMKKVWKVNIKNGMNLLDQMSIPELREKAKESFDRVLQGNSFTEVQHQFDLDIYFEFNWSPIFSSKKEVEGITCFVREITERKRAEENLKASLIEKEVLLNEIHHRVKNNLNVVVSLLNLQSRKIKDKQAVDSFKESINRIYTMALVHKKLYEEKNFSEINFKNYIQSMIEDMFNAYKIKNRVSLKLAIEDVSLNIEQAIPCGLIINELVSNSLKYAFPEGEKGTISILSKRLNNNTYQLSVKDDGVGIPNHVDFESTDSLGLKLVNLLVAQLNGKIKIKTNNGTFFKIQFEVKKDG